MKDPLLLKKQNNYLDIEYLIGSIAFNGHVYSLVILV